MLKWILLGGLIFIWLLGPMLFNAMARHDAANLRQGFSDAQQQAGAGDYAVPPQKSNEAPNPFY